MALTEINHVGENEKVAECIDDCFEAAQACKWCADECAEEGMASTTHLRSPSHTLAVLSSRERT